MFNAIRSLFSTPPQARTSGLGAGMSAQDDDRFSLFQDAWKKGATAKDMFGPNMFQLHGSVGGSGADNHRSDVAKVETFLGEADFYKPMTSDGPTGWHNTNLDSAIKNFQKANQLKVDGLLKPNGPTITKIGGLLGGGAVSQKSAPAHGATAQKSFQPKVPNGNPWGSAQGANPWEAENMAKVLLDRTDYAEAVKHFIGEFNNDPVAARPYTAAVYQAMAAQNPTQARQFFRQMAGGGLANYADEPPAEAPPTDEPPGDEKEPPEPSEPENEGNGDKEDGKYPPPRDPAPCLGEQVDLQAAWQARDNLGQEMIASEAKLRAIQEQIAALESGDAEPEGYPEYPDPSVPSPPDRRRGKGRGKGVGGLIGEVFKGTIESVDRHRKIAASRRAEIQRLTAKAASVQADIDKLEGQLKDADIVIAKCDKALQECRENSDGQRQ